MSTALLDVNLLIALAWPNHEHHLRSREWFNETGRHDWASCPVTQTGFIRISANPVIMEGPASPETACELLRHLTLMEGHHFWADAIDFALSERPGRLMEGHRQVTDAYLVMLADSHEGYLATMDRKIVNALAGTKWESRVVSII